MTLLLVVFVGNAAFAGDEITICAQNVQNFFYSLDRERIQGNYVAHHHLRTWQRPAYP